MRIYRIGDIELDPGSGCLRCNGMERPLRQKTFQVLLYLVEQRDRLVTKEEMLDAVWHGVAVTDNVLAQSVNDIRQVLGDDSRQPRFIKTIPRTGYRFIAPVEELEGTTARVLSVFETHSLQVELEEEIDTGPPRRGRPRQALLIAGGLLVAFGALAGYGLMRRSEPAGAKKTVAVLYFENQSGDADLNWLREGLADMLITDLTQSPGLAVLGRPQLKALRARIGHRNAGPIGLSEAMEVAKRGQAETIVLGSYGRIGEKTRIDAQMYDAASGKLVAAESLLAERPEQILTDTHLLSQRLAARLGANLGEGGLDRGLADVMTGDLQAYRYYSLGVEQVQAIHNREAIDLFQKAVDLDPQFAMAWARIGIVNMMYGPRVEQAKPYLEKAFRFSGRLTGKDRFYITAWYHLANLDFSRAIEELQSLLARYPTEVEAYLELARLLAGEVKTEEAVRVAQRGLAVDPEARDLYNLLANLHGELAHREESFSSARRYVELAPEEPNAYDTLAQVQMHFGVYDQAIENLHRSLALKPDFEVARVHLGNLYFRQGRYRDALREYERFTKDGPESFDRLRGYGLISWVHFRQGDPTGAAAELRRRFSSFENVAGLANLAAVETGVLRPGDFRPAPFPRVGRGSRDAMRPDYYWRARMALRNGRPEDALGFCKQAGRQRVVLFDAEDYEDYEDCAAHAFLHSGQWANARSEYQRILKLNPNDALAHYHLALALERTGALAQAQSENRKFLNLWNDADADIPEMIAARRRTVR